MNQYLSQSDPEWWMVAILMVEQILFVMYFVTVAYLLFFAVCSMFNKKNKYPTAKKLHRYAVMFHVGSQSETILKSVESLLAQNYPRSNYDLVVVSHSQNESINEILRNMSIVVYVAPQDVTYKADAIKYVMARLDASQYDVAVVMDADSRVDEDFLSQINNAYFYCSGGVAIQTHRKAIHLNSDTAIFGAVSEEINNSIFRRGHVNVGLSSALVGSGMAFEFEWLKKNIVNASHVDLEKQLETMLLEQSLFIEYLSNVYVYGDKVGRVEQFYEQRSHWGANRKESLRLMFTKLPRAIVKRNYDYMDKLFQWLMPSRTILMGTLMILSVALLFLAWSLAIKWWAIFILLIVAFSIALPDYLVDARFVKALRGAPFLFLLTVVSTIKNKIFPSKTKLV